MWADEINVNVVTVIILEETKEELRWICVNIYSCAS